MLNVFTAVSYSSVSCAFISSYIPVAGSDNEDELVSRAEENLSNRSQLLSSKAGSERRRCRGRRDKCADRAGGGGSRLNDQLSRSRPVLHDTLSLSAKREVPTLVVLSMDRTSPLLVIPQYRRSVSVVAGEVEQPDCPREQGRHSRYHVEIRRSRQRVGRMKALDNERAISVA